jgi:26S proteasome subunit RPN6 C-terminal helix domain
MRVVYEKPEADVRPFLAVASFFCPLNFPPPQNTYGAAIGTLAEVGKVVESLYAKVSHLLFSFFSSSSFVGSVLECILFSDFFFSCLFACI